MLRKDEEKKQAIQMRLDGQSLTTIVRELGVAKSSVSVWIRDVPVPERFTSEYRRKRREENARRLAEVREKRKKERKERRLLSGACRWMIHKPEGYEGKTYIKGRYVYEHRFLMEKKLGRLLISGEVVHHIDGDRLNNDLENLELHTRSEHTALHNGPAEKLDLICPTCGKAFTRFLSDIRFWRRRGRQRFFCSKRCSGKAGKKSGVS